VRLILDLDLPGPLHGELIAAAKEARVNPEIFAAECVESTLASRRLPFIRPAVLGARITSFDLTVE
jgi:hypothetical protein